MTDSQILTWSTSVQLITMSETKNYYDLCPVYNPENTPLWFSLMEKWFESIGIKDDKLWVYYILSALPPEDAWIFPDVSRVPEGENSYEYVKREILKYTEVPNETKYRLIFYDETLGGRKPTELLRRLERLALGTPVDAELLKVAFLQKLPNYVQAILSSYVDTTNLSKLAENADRIMEYMEPLDSQKLQYSGSTRSENFTSNQQTTSEMADLVNALKSLELKVDKLSSSARYWGRRSRSRSRSGPICYYHRKFGNEARNCEKPCRFW